jgi:Arc/MetJ family transcription regulator
MTQPFDPAKDRQEPINPALIPPMWRPRPGRFTGGAGPRRPAPPRTVDEAVAESRAAVDSNPTNTAAYRGYYAPPAGEPRRTARTNYDENVRRYGQNAGTAEGLAQRYSISLTDQAIADAARRRGETGRTAWFGDLITQTVGRSGHTEAAARASAEAQYTEDGRRISRHVGVNNIFEQQYDDAMRSAAETVFEVLNLDSIDAGLTYNVGVETERLPTYGSADSLERQANKGINPVRAREVLVQNTIQGGLADFQRLSAQQPDVYNAMVYRLWEAGLIEGEIADAGLGGWTPKVGKALAGAMAAVAQLNEQDIPTTLDEYIDSLARGRAEGLEQFGEGPERAPRAYADRDTVNARLKETAQSILGRALSDDEADRFASAFRGEEDANYDLAESGQAYENPSPSDEAQSFVEDGYETEAASFRIQGFMERLKSEMGL